MSTTTILDLRELGDSFAHIILTTEHPASSYGQPVLIGWTAGAAGPADTCQCADGKYRTAADFVAEESRLQPKIAADALVRKFLA